MESGRHVYGPEYSYNLTLLSLLRVKLPVKGVGIRR